jgi:hypothetical protein
MLIILLRSSFIEEKSLPLRQKFDPRISQISPFSRQAFDCNGSPSYADPRPLRQKSRTINQYKTLQQ